MLAGGWLHPPHVPFGRLILGSSLQYRSSILLCPLLLLLSTQRLIELSDHFEKQGSSVSDRGSPFAPLFSPITPSASKDGGESGGSGLHLVPKLQPKPASPQLMKEALPVGF